MGARPPIEWSRNCKAERSTSHRRWLYLSHAENTPSATSSTTEEAKFRVGKGRKKMEPEKMHMSHKSSHTNQSLLTALYHSLGQMCCTNQIWEKVATKDKAQSIMRNWQSSLAQHQEAEELWGGGRAGERKNDKTQDQTSSKKGAAVCTTVFLAKNKMLEKPQAWTMRSPTGKELMCYIIPWKIKRKHQRWGQTALMRIDYSHQDGEAIKLHSKE